MGLVPGARLGPYEILAKLGEGGMGEVYKARDTRLNRSVAVKVLPSQLASDPDRRGRFEREAHAIAALSHPHICTIHDIGRENGTDYLVMELLEGDTLADRLGPVKARPLPIQDVLRYAIEISDALDKAHRAGIVHRDLKPANIMITKSGAKLLDFGLAKLKEPAVPISMTAIEQASTTGGPKTASGTILGTVHYMSPEQVEGREADPRSDIWALGVVIYEMATGTRPFDGESAASIIGAILKDAPATVSSRQPLTPPALDHVVERCLEKDPDERWQNVGDIKQELTWIARAPAGVSSPAASTPRRAWTIPLAIALAALTAATAGLFSVEYVFPPNRSGPREEVRFEVLSPSDTTWSPAPVAATAQLAVSPDGKTLAFIAGKKGEAPRVWIRPLDRVEAQPLPGTEGATFPFWSPDSHFVAFFAGNKLKKINVEGGTPEALCNIIAGRGGAWSTSGIIVFGGQPNRALSQVSSQGGPVTDATTFDPAQGAVLNYWPQFLPDGRHFLYFQRSTNRAFQGIYVKSLDSPAATLVLQTDVRGIYTQGHLLFLRDGLLFAQAFDVQALRVSGEPVRIADHIGYFTASFGYASMEASSNGVLVYGPALLTSNRLRWFNRDGTSSILGPQGVFSSPQLSPDQTTIALSVRDAQTSTSDIWTYDVARGIPSRVTFDPSNDWFPTWMPDSARLLFGSTRSGSTKIFQIDTKDGSADRQVNTVVEGYGTYPDDVSRDGRFALFHVSTPTGYDIGTVDLDSGDKKSIPFLNTTFNEVQGHFSPDGRRVAYASDESGRFEVYVRAFPSAAERKQISIEGGMEPEWRGDGKELFYLSADQRIMAVPITTDGTNLIAGAPHPLFSVDVVEPSAPFPVSYAVSADGQRFAVNSFVNEPNRQTLTVLLNWADAVRK
jgi:eukaryotic-like serine/threonine-protein kinase